jgi:hypothetical protein
MDPMLKSQQNRIERLNKHLDLSQNRQAGLPDAVRFLNGLDPDELDQMLITEDPELELKWQEYLEANGLDDTAWSLAFERYQSSLSGEEREKRVNTESTSTFGINLSEVIV